MSNVNNLIFSCLSLILLAILSVPSVRADTFKTRNGALLDPCEQSLVLRGVNAGVAFPSDLSASSLSQIEQTGANAVRLTFRWLFNKSNPESVAIALQKAAENHMLAIPSVWDASGNWSKLSFAVDFWTQPEMVTVLRQYEDILVLNIGNEVGDGSVAQEDYRLGYQQAIERIREAGLHMPLLIDAAGYGRNESYILNNANYLISKDPDHNLLFGWHPWDTNQPQSRYKRAIDLAKKNRIPLLISEFAHVGAMGEGSVDYRYIMQYTAERNVGWLWWWWSSGATPDYHALTTDGAVGNWANVGEEVIVTSPYGISATSRRTDYLQNRSCIGNNGQLLAPTAPSNLTAVATEGAEVSLTWEDKSDNERNFDIEVWDETNQLWRLVKTVAPNTVTTTIGAGAEFVYSLSDSSSDLSLNYATNYRVRVGAYRTKDAVAYSDPVTVTTSANPSVCGNGDGLLGEYFIPDDYIGLWDLVRVDPQINFDWGSGSPDPSDPNAPKDNFMVVWQGEIEPQFDGEYTFYTSSDNYARVLIDGRIVVDNWGLRSSSGWALGKVQMQAGVRYSIQVEHHESVGNARMFLYWANTKLKRELVPQCRLFAQSM
ncbi:MAG: PA14 domain-containing protein [Gammaproteobacteria bacterium]